jgi:chromosome segregation ATPase
MSSLKQIKLAQKAAALHQEVIAELQSLTRDIERCEKTIAELKQELQGINSRQPAKRTTREDISYLTDLLECAKKKLTWEKHIGSLQRRTPLVLQKMAQLLNDRDNPPSEQARAEMLVCLQSVQATMERLQSVHID